MTDVDRVIGEVRAIARAVESLQQSDVQAKIDRTTMGSSIEQIKKQSADLHAYLFGGSPTVPVRLDRLEQRSSAVWWAFAAIVVMLLGVVGRLLFVWLSG